jgi:hypothetical protein
VGALAIFPLLREQPITVGVARASETVLRELEGSGLLVRIGVEHRRPSVDEAVQALREGG